MERVGQGDISALDALYARYQKRLLFYFHRMLSGDVEQAQDMLQDLFLKLVERPDLYHAGRPFSTWVFSIAHNMCKNVYRKKDTTAAKVIRQGSEDEGAFDIESVEADMQTAADALDHASFVAMLRVELDLLDPDAKAAFLLRHQEDFSIRDIAQTLGCPEGTVKSRLFNTTRKLADRLRVFDPIHDQKAQR